MTVAEAEGKQLGCVHVLNNGALAVADIWFYRKDNSMVPPADRSHFFVFDLHVRN